ncbi:MAG: YdiU family protein [Gammaproteobacteria bacterium]|nr:YdiU family protein [Gammaproteobacteria bacterium]NNJ51236.1 YdiU family protein [Gammaproteobacteria bacterium]
MNNFSFKNRYIDLGKGFYELRKPTPVTQPSLIKFNDELGAELGMVADGHDIDKQDEVFLAGLFSGNLIHDTSEPLAMAYAGHQFGHFNPQLGDGRAIYLGELAHVEGSSLDVQLKGSGQTCYSRNGDGRAALGPVLREYLVSEAMHKLNVPTTRALAAVTTGEEVVREQLLPGGIITRTASSFIRVGSFQYFQMQEDAVSVKALADYVIERNYPYVAETQKPYIELLEAVVLRQASLIAQWMAYGFIHGVMNTDNMSIAGETIDYGPCAFMDFYNHGQVYSSIDRNGRYAYNNQASIGLWNLSRFAETLLPLFADDIDAAVEIAKDILQKYIERYDEAWLANMRAKCGLSTCDDVAANDDKTLIESLLEIMHENQADFTLTFYHLSQLNVRPGDKDTGIRDLFKKPDAIDAWLVRWRQRLSSETMDDSERQQGMRSVNPVYIPRNHQIEAVIRAAEDHDDFAPFHALHAVLQDPFQYQQGRQAYMLPPEPEEVVLQTFCGT